ncbi:HutD family protein [Streptomyces sp. NBC_00005]|uniref:HutD/Ves family protein n=1 Tax=Streptomyces sp. NBC_00005 TaxID=2903609 RepID=UPI00324B2939
MPTRKPPSNEPAVDSADALRVIRTATLEPQPWANGRGRTREIHCEPATGTPETITWRLSLADIEEPGPFSQFPGMERHLLSAAPVPLQLSVDGVVHDLRHTQSVSFSGDSDVVTTAVDGRAQALNLMVRSGIRGSFELLRGDMQLPVSAECTTALVVIDGIVSLGGRQLMRFDAVLPGAGETRLGLQSATVVRVRVETPVPDA